MDRFNRVWLIAVESTLVKVAHLESFDASRSTLVLDKPAPSFVGLKN